MQINQAAIMCLQPTFENYSYSLIFISICPLHETKSDLNFAFIWSIELLGSECCFRALT